MGILLPLGTWPQPSAQPVLSCCWSVDSDLSAWEDQYAVLSHLVMVGFSGDPRGCVLGDGVMLLLFPSSGDSHRKLQEGITSVSLPLPKDPGTLQGDAEACV